MAHHGRTDSPPAPPPRPAARAAVTLPGVHRPPPPPPRRPVTLDNPRPDQLRSFNIYTSTPGVPEPGSVRTSGGDGSGSGSKAPPVKKRTGSSVISEQPAPLKPLKRRLEPSGPTAAGGSDTDSDVSSVLRDSFICERCGKCRCEACRTAQPLPQRLLCSGKCVLSAETCVDCLSCLCCVKALGYHCTASDSGSRDVDKPCSCTGGSRERCCLRWGGLAVLSTVLPCLWLYWPLRGGVKLVELCHQRCSGGRAGCSCPAAAGSEGQLLPSR